MIPLQNLLDDVKVLRNRSRPLAEMAAKAFTKGQESLPDPSQQSSLSVGGRVFIAADGTSIMGCFIKPCLLIRDA